MSLDAFIVDLLLIHRSKDALSALQDAENSQQITCASSAEDAENFILGLHVHS